MKRSWHFGLLAVLLLASISLNALLSRELVQAKQKIAELSAAILRIKSEGQLKAGQRVPPIEAFELSGRPVKVSYSEAQLPVLLYFLSPTCGWCQRNSGNIQALASSVEGRYRLYGLSLSKQGVQEYVATHGAPFPVLVDLPLEVVNAYKLGGTPRTIVVSRDGTVARNWSGAYTGALQHEVEDFFGVKLPGLQMPAD